MNIVNTLGLPKDVIFGSSTLKVIGKNQIYLENFKYIIEYNSSVIVVKVKDSIITICGKALIIERYSCDELEINGCISEIKYS